MTKEALKELQDWLATLSGDALQGALDALQTVQASRTGADGSMPPPPTMDIDPELEDPEVAPSSTADDDVDVEDPDGVLKDKHEKAAEREEEKDDKKGSSGSGKASKTDSIDTEIHDDEEDDEYDKENEDEAKSEGAKSDSEPESEIESDSELVDDEKTDEEEIDEIDDDEMVDDDDIELSDTLTKDAEEEAAKQEEIFRRKVDLAGAIKQIKRAEKKIAQGEVTATEAQIKELSDLKDEAEKRLTELTENPESVKDLDADDFNDFISKILDAVDKLGVRHVKIGDRSSKIKKIKDDLEDALTSDDFDNEDSENKQRDPDFKKLKAREAENERIKREMEKDLGAAAFKGNIEDFKRDLKKAIGDQIQTMIEVEEETYARVNRHHEDDDMALPGIRIDEIPEYKKPSIDIYFDQSGSWGKSEVSRGMAAIADILELEKEDLLKLNIYYFSEILTQDQNEARARGLRECWDLVIQNIDTEPKTQNVIIMTDSDIGHDYGSPGQRGCKNGIGTTVSGCVWFLWKNGKRVPEASKKLRGRQGTFEYSV